MAKDVEQLTQLANLELSMGTNERSLLYGADDASAASDDEPIKPTKKTKKRGSKGFKEALTKSLMAYDLDGDGMLDEVEQAMYERDVDRDGHLSNEEVYAIVKDHLSSRKDYGLYRRIAAALVCLVSILALCNFGTSWATAVLAKETVADADTGTIQSKGTGEVMGFQEAGHVVEMDSLTDEEFDERRRLVDEALAADPDDEDHLHRRLANKEDNKKKKKKKCNNGACSQVLYDHNKIGARDLERLVKKCEGANVVRMSRKWRNREGAYNEDVEVMCGPGTEVVRKQKKKKNKNKTKTKLVDERVTFRKKGRDGSDRNIHFECDKRGNCFTSGETFLQGRSHPCNPGRDECQQDLYCYDPYDLGSGTCIELQPNARKGQPCNMNLDVDACKNGYSCSASRNSRGAEAWVGICMEIRERTPSHGVCNASFGDVACDFGYVCLATNGRDLGGLGFGVCTRLARGVQQPGNSCDLSFGLDACASGLYCRDNVAARNAAARNEAGAGMGGNAGTSAVISGPSGMIANGNGVGVGGMSAVTPRTSGTGTCMRTRSVGGMCTTNQECGNGFTCLGLGATTSTGGVIQGSSGRIEWGTGGATSGFCG